MSNIIGIDVSKLSLDCAWLRNLDQATIYLVNPSMVRKFAAGMGILSKNDLKDSDSYRCARLTGEG